MGRYERALKCREGTRVDDHIWCMYGTVMLWVAESVARKGLEKIIRLDFIRFGLEYRVQSLASSTGYDLT